MDCRKTGHLICMLRKEKGLTQRQVAEQLNISHKTVSKWECGLGCPDLSLWPGLSSILGIEMEKILEGKLDRNLPDVGKLDYTRFYVCPVCGNILFSTGKASLSCCGRRLQPLSVTPADGHAIKVEEMDTDYWVTMHHEMTKQHYISFVAYVGTDRVLVIRLYPEQDAQVRIPILQRDGRLYVYCTSHGLQQYEKKL